MDVKNAAGNCFMVARIAFGFKAGQDPRHRYIQTTTNRVLRGTATAMKVIKNAAYGRKA